MKKDYCTLAPDKIFSTDISECCKKHDTLYTLLKLHRHEKTLKNKIKADAKLFHCISKKTNIFIGSLYFIGVSLFGYRRYFFNTLSNTKAKTKYNNKS